MTYLEICFLAYALSIDACVVSFSYGLSNYDSKTRRLLALFTGAFQGLMPVIGYYLAKLVVAYIQSYAKIIVFGIFVCLGIKFILEAFQEKNEKRNCITFLCLFLIGIATSIDAFSAGISLLLSGNNILKPAILIALVTFINSNIGFVAGFKLKKLPSKYLAIFAGLILIVLGIRAII